MTTKKIEEIKTHPLFEALFVINGEVQAKIERDMRDSGYDISQPIILATWEGQKEPVCIDGHTRLQAAINARITDVPVYPRAFETEQSALEYAIRLQTNRRNLSDGDLMQCIEMLHESLPRGGDQRSDDVKSTPKSCGNQNGRSAGAKRTADLLNISSRKVEQALTIINKGLPEIKEAVLKNEMSINKAYEKTQKQRKQLEAELSRENSDDEAADENLEARRANKAESTGPKRVSLSMEHFGALRELGGSIEEHVAYAIEAYLESLGKGDEENPEESDQENAKDGEGDDEEYFDPNEFQNEQEKGEHAEDATDSEDTDEDKNEDEKEDDEEYFDPADYEDD